MSDNQLELLYPGINQYGSLGKLLDAEFKRIGSPLARTGWNEFGRGSLYSTYIRRGTRSGNVGIAARETLFMASFWVSGVQLASLQTPSLTVLANSLHMWLIEECSTSSLQDTISAVVVSESTSFYEDGPTAYVEFKWAKLREQTRQMMPRLYPVVQLAYGTPAFRQLLPYTSLDTLCFSRCTGYPFTRDCPTIAPSTPGVFRVLDPKRKPLGEGNADTAVEIARANLPADCGPALHGTAADMDYASPPNTDE
jgi:hypothetical protein